MLVGAKVGTGELCPRCGVRWQEDEASGFCGECADEAVVDRYHEREAQAIARRRDAWAARTESARRSPASSRPANRERQRRHRLIEAVRPRDPAPDWTDPFVLAREALHALAQARSALGVGASGSRDGGRELLAQVEEIVRQLAWGPGG